MDMSTLLPRLRRFSSALFILAMMTPAEAGLLDAVKEQADKAKKSLESLNHAINQTPEGHGINPSRTPDKQGVYGELVLRRLWVAGIGRGNVISTGIG